MTTFADELDDILLNFAKRIESTPRGKTYNWSDERKALLNLVSERIIGEDQHTEHKEWDCPCGATHSFTEEWHATNRLRVDQRTTLYECNKEEEE